MSENGWLGLGLAWQALEQQENAVTAFSEALKLTPKLVQAQFDLGISQMNLRHYPDAIAAFTKAVEVSPRNYKAQI